MIKWPELFNTGIEEIDRQHKRLVELINLAFYSMNRNASQMDIMLVFSELQDYVKYHLRYEEHFILEINYPDYEKHKMFHDHFEDDIFAYQHDFEHNTDILLLRDKLVKFLLSWLVEHIVEDDKKYAEYYFEHKKEIEAKRLSTVISK